MGTLACVYFATQSHLLLWISSWSGSRATCPSSLSLSGTARGTRTGYRDLSMICLYSQHASMCTFFLKQRASRLSKRVLSIPRGRASSNNNTRTKKVLFALKALFSSSYYCLYLLLMNMPVNKLFDHCVVVTPTLSISGEGRPGMFKYTPCTGIIHFGSQATCS